MQAYSSNVAIHPSNHNTFAVCTSNRHIIWIVHCIAKSCTKLLVWFDYLLPAANLSKLPIVDGDHVRGLTAVKYHRFCETEERERERERDRKKRERERESTHEETPLGKGMKFEVTLVTWDSWGSVLLWGAWGCLDEEWPHGVPSPQNYPQD